MTIDMKFNTKTLFSAAIASAAALFLTVSCDKPYELDLPLAVTTRDIQLQKEAGKTPVIVYSTGEWTARLTENVDWASLDKLSGFGNHQVVFSYAANYGVARQVGIIFATSEKTDTVLMTQAGTLTETKFTLGSGAVNCLKGAGRVTIPVSTDLLYGMDAYNVDVNYIHAQAEEEGGDTKAHIHYSEPDGWISDVALTAKAASFNVAENNTGEIRSAEIVFTLPNPGSTNEFIKTTLKVSQGLDEARLSFDPEKIEVSGAAGKHEALTKDNNVWPYAESLTITVAGDGISEQESWISNLNLTATGLAFNVTANESETTRKAIVTIAYTGGVSASVEIGQTASPKPVPFETVRAMAAGVISTNGFIEGYIVSDFTSKNICQNVQTAQFKFDYMDTACDKIAENDKTAYIESTDGKYGFCLKFDNVADNNIERYSKVRILLSGLTLVKEANPARYYLTGVTAASILEVKAPDMFKIPAKKMTIAQLSEADIFTQVTLTGVEILAKDGCYTNCTDGYSFLCPANPASGSSSAPRWDTAPLMMTDAEGNWIDMLTNSQVLWRRSGKNYEKGKAELDMKWNTVLPQGSGNFTGVVVAEELVRYGKTISPLQVRAMTLDDIALTGNAFSNTIVEWNWNDRAANLTPEIGAGTISGAGTTAAASDFNNTYNGRSGDGGNGGSTSNQKGLVTNAAIKFTKAWWDKSANKGSYFDISFSTAGISGSNMVFGIIWGHGAMGNTTLDSPAHWQLQYSVDGATFKNVGDIITNRSVVWWTTTSQDSTPGFTEHLRKLPAECFGKENVTLRLLVADNVADGVPGTSASTWQTNLGIEKGTIGTTQTSGQEIRIGTITVRYN